MVSEVLSNYITIRYQSWLDYARYHCLSSGMEDEAIDVLNEVLLMFVEKANTNKDMMRLYENKKGEYRELDFYILHMIKLNITSVTSPYRHKYKYLPVDKNINYEDINIIDEEDPEVDKVAIILEQMHKVRDIFESLNLSDNAKKVFSYKFFEGEQFSKWQGPEDKQYLYYTYNKVLNMIRDKINGNSLF